MKKFILILTVLSFFFSKVSATELTLQDCIAMALKNNRGLKACEMDILYSDQDKKISRTRFFPSFGVKGEYTLRDKSDQFIFDRDVFAPEIPPEDVKFSTDNQNTYGVTFTVEQPLFTGGLLTHSLNKAGKVQEKTYHRAKREKRALTFKVKKSFYEVLKERDCRKALEKLIESKETRLSVLNERQGEGYIKYDEILQLETDIAFIKTDLCRTKNREDLALSRLKELIQYVGSDEIIPKGEYFNLHFTASLQEVKDAAMKNREEVKISLSQIMATEEDIKIAESGFYPQVILKGNYSLQKETNVTLPQVWALLAQIDWPFFEWGRTRSEVIKSKTGRQRLVYEHDELQRSIRMEVEEAWRAVKDEEELVKAYDKKLKTAEYKLNLIKENYSEGKVKLIDMIEMETELIKSYTEYLTALADLAIGFAQLEASASVLDDGWFVTEERYSPDYNIHSK